MATTSRQRERGIVHEYFVTKSRARFAFKLIYIYIYINYVEQGHKLLNPRKGMKQLATQRRNGIAHDYERSFPFPPSVRCVSPPFGGGKMLIGVETSIVKGSKVQGYRFPDARLLERCFGKNERFPPRGSRVPGQRRGGRKEKRERERSEPVENR